MTFIGMVIVQGAWAQSGDPTGTTSIGSEDVWLAPSAPPPAGLTAVSVDLAPYGHLSLTRGRASIPILSDHTWVGITGLSSDQWTDVSIMGQHRFKVTSDFSVGVVGSFHLRGAKGFQNNFGFDASIHANMRVNSKWRIAAILENAATLRTDAHSNPRVLGLGVGWNGPVATSVDVMFRQGSPLALGLSGVIQILEIAQMRARIVSAPFTFQFGTRVAYADLPPITVGAEYVFDIGIRSRFTIEF